MYLLPMFYCSLSLNCSIPNSITLACSFFYFLWMVLDNMDGKQARRTKNSSPLGLIFDHQVDALCVSISVLVVGIITLYGNSYYTLTLWLLGAIPFFLATWEELYVGEQIFPVINGPSDGCLIVGFVITVIGLCGPEYFITNTYAGHRYMDLIFYFFLVSSPLIGLYR